MHTYTTISVLLALYIGFLAMPELNIVKVCAWNVGTARIEAWRVRVGGALDRLRRGSSRLWLARFLTEERGEAAIDLLTAGGLGGARIKFLKQAKADTYTEIQQLRATVGASNEPMTDEQRTKFAALEKRFDAIEQDLTIEARAADRERQMKPVGDDNARAAAAADQASGVKKTEGFANFGERLQAVRRAALPGGRVDPRLMAVAAGMSESNPADGGFLVDQDRVTTIRQRMYETGQILSRVFQLPIGANSNGVKLMAIDETSRADGARYGGITSYWLDEGGTKTASKPKFRPMELNLKKVAALVRVTDELLADTTALEAWVMRFLPLELKFKAEDAIVSGTGAGMPLGFLNSGATIAVTRTTPGTIVFEDIQNMWSRFYAPSRSAPGAAWFVDQSAEPALFSMSLQVGAGGIPVYLPANGISNKPFSTLFGLPVIPAEYLSALGTKGDIMLADLSQYTLIDKGDVQSASSIHVYFVTDETAFRFVYRVDGQPEWAQPLTPKNSGPTLSPFVVLAT